MKKRRDFKMELIQQYILSNYYILVPVLWIIGYALKQTPIVPDWLIIWLLLASSIFLCGFAYGFTFEAITNGILVTGVSVLGHQITKQNPFNNDLKK
jgi:uncharacterized RDD family membrane protein YckC